MLKVPHTKIGLVGCGPRGIGHVHALKKLEGAEWIGGCDLDADRRAAFKTETGLPAFESLDDLLNESPDVVSVATNVESHAPLGTKVLEAGIPLVIEKPLAPTAEESFQLVKLAREKGLVAAVSFQLHYHPFAARMRELCRQIHPMLINHSRHSGLMAPQYLRPGKLTGVFDFLVHEIDLIRWWTGQQIEAVTARLGCGVYSDAGAPDLAILHLDLSGDESAAATLVASMAGAPLSRVIQVAGKTGAIEARFAGELKFKPTMDAKPELVEIEKAELEGTEALYRDLILATAGEEVPSMPTLQDGLAAVAVIEAAFESHQTSRRVEIKPEYR